LSNSDIGKLCDINISIANIETHVIFKYFKSFVAVGMLGVCCLRVRRFVG